MLESKRKFKRFDLPIVVAFRPTYGSTEYSMGLMRNFSCEGLGLVAYNFSFIPQENLELNLKFPHSGTFFSLFGSVVWKMQTGDKCMAGVKLKLMDEKTQNQMLEKMSSYGNIPINNILFSKDADYKIEDETEVKSVSKPVKHQSKSLKKSRKLGFIKQYLKGGSKCKVTFRLPKDAAPNAQNVTIVGDFNKWNTTKTQMNRLKSGDFLITLELRCKREYKFRYLIDGNRWENDWCADKYIPNNFGSDDSVVIV